MDFLFEINMMAHKFGAQFRCKRSVFVHGATYSTTFSKTMDCHRCGLNLADKLSLVAHVSLCVHGEPVRNVERKSPVCLAIRNSNSAAPGPRIFAMDALNLAELENEEKPFKCNMCDKKFSRKLTLTRHMQTHSGFKPFECHICGKRLSRKHVLVQHLKTHLFILDSSRIGI